MQIEAAVVDHPGAAPQVRRLTIEPPRPDEILVQVHACGVCHTDMVLRDGAVPLAFPAVLGHEGAGVVAAVGEDIDDVVVGDRVVLTFRSCGKCRRCRAGDRAYCELFFPLNMDGRRSDGSSKLRSEDGTAVSGDIFGQSAFATYALAYRDNVVRVRTELPFELLGPLGCGIQTGAGAVLEALRVASGDRVAVLGAGAVGLAAIMAARSVGAEVIAALDLHPSRLGLARELGATHIGSVVDQLPDQLDYVIDATGVAALAGEAGAKLANCGTLALVGVYPPGGGLPIDPGFLMSGGRKVVGIVEGGVDPQTFIPRLVKMVESGELPIRRLVRAYGLGEVSEAMTASESGAVIKPVLIMESAAQRDH